MFDCCNSGDQLNTQVFYFDNTLLQNKQKRYVAKDDNTRRVFKKKPFSNKNKSTCICQTRLCWKPNPLLLGSICI